MAGFEPTTTTPPCSALPGCATSRRNYYENNYIYLIINSYDAIKI